MPPTMANGKICYIEIPAIDIQESVSFYESVFGWQIRRRGDGSVAFDDAVGEVSGTWVLGRPPSSKVGLLVYIMVDSVAATVDAVIAREARSFNPSAWMRRKSRQAFLIRPATYLVSTSNRIVQGRPEIDQLSPNHWQSLEILLWLFLERALTSGLQLSLSIHP